MTAPDSYLDKFPVEHRNSVNRAYEDGYLDGINDQHDDGEETAPTPEGKQAIWIMRAQRSRAGKFTQTTVWRRLPDAPHLSMRRGPVFVTPAEALDDLVNVVDDGTRIDLFITQED